VWETKITVDGIPGQIEQSLDHPSAGEDLAIVLGAGDYKCHRHTLGISADACYADTLQVVDDTGIGSLPVLMGADPSARPVTVTPQRHDELTLLRRTTGQRPGTRTRNRLVSAEVPTAS
jgi:hypothetical protein